MIDLWYKNAITYSLDVDAFADSNGDGIGDFAGLTSGSSTRRAWTSPASGSIGSWPTSRT